MAEVADTIQQLLVLEAASPEGGGVKEAGLEGREGGKESVLILEAKDFYDIKPSRHRLTSCMK